MIFTTPITGIPLISRIYNEFSKIHKEKIEKQAKGVNRQFTEN